MTAVALVMKTPMAAKTNIVVGRATVWPITCSRWLRPKRVKSGMFRDSVAQKPTMPVSEGTKTFQNEPKSANLLCCASSGPMPFAAS